jgi:hypothetical protein
MSSRQLASIPLAERLLFLTLKFCVNQVKSALSWHQSLDSTPSFFFKANIDFRRNWINRVLGLVRMEQEE